MEQNIEAMLTDDEFGFRRNHGTREAILALRLIIERRLERNRKTYIAFVDIEKAFDSFKWDKMFEVLKKVGISYRDWKVMWSLYKNGAAVIASGKQQEQVEKV